MGERERDRGVDCERHRGKESLWKSRRGRRREGEKEGEAEEEEDLAVVG